MSSAVARENLRLVYEGTADRSDPWEYLNHHAWLASGDTMPLVGRLLAEPYSASRIDAVVAPESSGIGFGVLTAAHLGCGFVRMGKDRDPAIDSDAFVRYAGRPDWVGKVPDFSLRRALVPPGTRVMVVDDVVETGAQLQGARSLCERAGAIWVGSSVLIDKLDSQRVRQDLRVASVFTPWDLP